MKRRSILAGLTTCGVAAAAGYASATGYFSGHSPKARKEPGSAEEISLSRNFEYDETENRAFEQWSMSKGAQSGAIAVEEIIKNTFQDENLRVIVHDAGERLELVVNLLTTVDNQGDIKEEPIADFKEVVSATPKTANVKITTESREASHSYSVFVEDRYRKQL